MFQKGSFITSLDLPDYGSSPLIDLIACSAGGIYGK